MDFEVFQSIWITVCSNKTVVFIVVILAIVNWTLEGLKLKLLLRSVLDLNIVRSFFVVLGGMAISNFTPARTGEFIGRSLLLKTVHPIKVTLATVAGNIAQMLMTYLLGLLAAVGTFIFTDHIGVYQDSSKLVYVALLICGIFLVIWRGRYIVEKLGQYLPKQLRKSLKLVRRFSKELYKRIVVLSLLRYVVFSLQFFILLSLFSDWNLPISVLILVPIAYLMQTLFPVPAVSDIGIRLAVCGVLFGPYMTEPSILYAVSFLWLLNLIVPGVIGSIYLFISTVNRK